MINPFFLKTFLPNRVNVSCFFRSKTQIIKKKTFELIAIVGRFHHTQVVVKYLTKKPLSYCLKCLEEFKWKSNETEYNEFNCRNDFAELDTTVLYRCSKQSEQVYERFYEAQGLCYVSSVCQGNA